MALPYTGARFIVKLWDAIFEALFPSECVQCHNEGPWLCENCHANTVAIKLPTCPFCDRLSPLGKTCITCKRMYPLTGCRSLWYYRGPVKTLISSIKYHTRTAAVTTLEAPLAQLMRELPFSPHAQVIVTAVPSSPGALHLRGYNQSELLAKICARTRAFEYYPLLTRAKRSQSQTRLTRKARFANVVGQFSRLSSAPSLTNTTVIIVDDVITTGATLAACAAILKEAGAKAVWGITVAKD